MNSCVSIIVIFSVFHACDVFCGAADAGLKPVSLYTERLHLKPTRSRSGIPKKLLIPSTWPITFPIHTYCIHDYPDGDIKCRCLKCRIPQGNNNVLYIVNSVYTLNFIACEPRAGHGPYLLLLWSYRRVTRHCIAFFLPFFTRHHHFSSRVVLFCKRAIKYSFSFHGN